MIPEAGTNRIRRSRRSFEIIACGEDADLGSDPLAFSGPEDLADRLECCSIEAIGEPAFSTVRHRNPQIYGTVFDRQAFNDFFRLSLFCPVAGDLFQDERSMIPFYNEVGIVAAHNNEARPLPIMAMLKGEFGRSAEFCSRHLLQQQIGSVPKILPFIRRNYRIDAQISHCRRETPQRIGIVGMDDRVLYRSLPRSDCQPSPCAGETIRASRK